MERVARLANLLLESQPEPVVQEQALTVPQLESEGDLRLVLSSAEEL
ncbi:MAG: hypothetical protein HC866_06675 [Leptolyngbyaceae cyanobacterium RU_5_1]|nr:hypothetical protein [Leptolyngbyaceae cyanobacterium RU_5_1]